MEETLKSNSDMDEHQIQANIHGLAIMDTCIALSQLVHIISGWQNRHKLVVIMNQWTRLERSLKTILHDYRRANADAGVEAGKYYCSITLVAAIVLLTTMSPFLLGIIAPSEPDRTLEFALIPVMFAYYGITEASQDAVVNLMFYELSKSMQLVIKVMASANRVTEIYNVRYVSKSCRTWRGVPFLKIAFGHGDE